MKPASSFFFKNFRSFQKSIKNWLGTVVLLMLCSFSAQAQNIQVHYDFGRNMYSSEESNRQKVTVTVENFSADRLGSWYYFVDIDLSRKFVESAYTEISREFNLWKEAPLACHLEYDGGLNRFGSFQQAALVGAAWNTHSEDFSKTFSVQLLYKRFFKSYDNTSAYHSMQLTGVWNMTFANKACTFAGFIDFWRGQDADGHGQLVLLTEPQFWYNLNTLPFMNGINLSIGSEIEISNNFIYNTYSEKSFFINPTLALKWSF